MLSINANENASDVAARSHSVTPIFAFLLTSVIAVTATHKTDTIKVPKGNCVGGKAQQNR